MKILVILLTFLLTSCSEKPIPIAYECPKINLPTDPDMPITKLTPQSNPGEVMKAYVATVIGLRNWNLTVRKQITSSL